MSRGDTRSPGPPPDSPPVGSPPHTSPKRKAQNTLFALAGQPAGFRARAHVDLICRLLTSCSAPAFTVA